MVVGVRTSFVTTNGAQYHPHRLNRKHIEGRRGEFLSVSQTLAAVTFEVRHWQQLHLKLDIKTAMARQLLGLAKLASNGHDTNFLPSARVGLEIYGLAKKILQLA